MDDYKPSGLGKAIADSIRKAKVKKIDDDAPNEGNVYDSDSDDTAKKESFGRLIKKILGYGD